MTAALGTYGDSCTPPSKRQDNRASRHGIKRAQRALTDSVSSMLCWYSAAALVAVDIGSSLTSQVSGIHRCGSPWSCLLCAPVIRERRAVEIDAALAIHLGNGGGAELVTLTLRHYAPDSLAPRLDVVTQALALTLRGSPWDRRKLLLGYVGAIRAIEVTDGANGWHPHNHALLLFDHPLSEAERADLNCWLLGRWGGVVESRGFGTINAHGVDVRPVVTASDMAGYLCKIDGGWGIGLELARSDLKGSSPIGHLRHFAETGDMASGRRWQEYERATFGKRATRWSPGLRGLLLGDETEQSDADLAASEGLDLTMVRALIPHRTWDRTVKAGAAGQLLTDLEHIAALLLTITPNPQPLEDPRHALVPR